MGSRKSFRLSMMEAQIRSISNSSHGMKTRLRQRQEKLADDIANNEPRSPQMPTLVPEVPWSPPRSSTVDSTSTSSIDWCSEEENTPKPPKKRALKSRRIRSPTPSDLEKQAIEKAKRNSRQNPPQLSPNSTPSHHHDDTCPCNLTLTLPTGIRDEEGERTPQQPRNGEESATNNSTVGTEIDLRTPQRNDLCYNPMNEEYRDMFEILHTVIRLSNTVGDVRLVVKELQDIVLCVAVEKRQHFQRTHLRK